MNIQPGSSIGRYHIQEQLGEGGMATVYKAYDTHLEREVAIKVIRTGAFPPDVLDRILKRFDREAKSLARLNHPNIVGIIDYGEQGGTPYLVMPFYPAGTLKQSLGKPMPPAEAARLLAPVARALAYAHQQGILHRDVKPSNILITASGEPVLTDFGIAKLLEDDSGATLTGTGVGVGTPEYMAPEQGMGREIDGRADVYALGVVLYELVTGRKPYTADTPMAVIFKHLTDPLPRPKEYVPDLPERVEQIIFKAMAKKPEDRYQSMGDFAKALPTIDARSQNAATRIVDSPSSSPRSVSDLYDVYEEETGEATLDMGETTSAPAKTANRVQDTPVSPISKPAIESTNIPRQQVSRGLSEAEENETGEATFDLGIESVAVAQAAKPTVALASGPVPSVPEKPVVSLITTNDEYSRASEDEIQNSEDVLRLEGLHTSRKKSEHNTHPHTKKALIIWGFVAIGILIIEAIIMIIGNTWTSASVPAQVVIQTLPTQTITILPEISPTQVDIGTALLTVSGKMEAPNSGNTFVIDQAFFDRNSVEIKLDDPWMGNGITYKGILIRDLLTSMKVSSDALTFRVIATDGSGIDISINDAMNWNIMLAHWADGIELTNEVGGPVKIVFPADARSTYPDDDWFWWLTSVEVK